MEKSVHFIRSYYIGIIQCTVQNRVAFHDLRQVSIIKRIGIDFPFHLLSVLYFQLGLSLIGRYFS
jgi:hypothetical protein